MRVPKLVPEATGERGQVFKVRSRPSTNALKQKPARVEHVRHPHVPDPNAAIAHFDAGEAAVRAIEAGNDMVFYSSDTDAAIAAVREAVGTGRITEARIDESVARILEARRGLRGVMPSVSEGPGRKGAGADATNAHHPRPQIPRSTLGMTADHIAARAITLVRDTNHLLPLRDQSIAIRVFSADDRRG